MHPNMNKGETGKVESSKKGEERSVEDSHHCVAAREGALNKKTFISLLRTNTRTNEVPL